MIDEQTDREFTLGAGKLLGLFFGLVVLCAAFFGIGFSLGKSSFSGAAANLIPDTSSSSTPKASAASGAVATEPAPTAAAPAANPAETPSQPAVEPVAAPQPAASPAPAPLPIAAAANQPSRTVPETANNATAANAAAGGYLVQVAAVTKKEDAEALVAALRRKQYAAFMALNPLDSFFHVQIGPFAEPKQADALKARLVSDGYNPIVKR